LNSSDDEDHTAFVRPPPTTAPSAPQTRVDVEVDDDVDDKTVMMKPSLRAREAAEALHAERTRQPPGQTPPATATGGVDFDVTRGATAAASPAPTTPPRRGRPAWTIGLLVIAVIAVIAVLAVAAAVLLL